MEDPVDSLEPALGFGVDAIVGLVVELERAALLDVFRFTDVRQGQLGQPGEIHLFDHRPRVLNLGGGKGGGGRKRREEEGGGGGGGRDGRRKRWVNGSESANEGPKVRA